MPFTGSISEAHRVQRVALSRLSGSAPSGLYRCEIPIKANQVNGDGFVREILVYVGLFGSKEGYTAKLLSTWRLFVLGSYHDNVRY